MRFDSMSHREIKMKSVIFASVLFFSIAFARPFFPMDETDTPRRSPAYELGQVDILNYRLLFRFQNFSLSDTLVIYEEIDFINLSPFDTIYFFDFEVPIETPFMCYYLDDFVWRVVEMDFHDSLLALHLGPLDVGDTIRVVFSPPYIVFAGRGIYKETSVDGSIVFSLFWPSLARRAFVCIDHPADRATCDLEFYLPHGVTVAAGGELVDSIADTSGAIRWKFRYNEPVCTYNISFAIGNYAGIETSASSGTIPIKSYAYPSRLTQTSYDFARIPQMIELFDSLIGPYPFARFGCAVTPMSVWGGAGAMEHQMIPNIGERLITGTRAYETVIAHELFHQWFGDCIGISDWRDFWLNEGIAVYSEVLWKEHVSGISSARTYMGNIERNYRTYAISTADFPIYDPLNYLSPIPYNKGACWWHMLRWMLGDSAFFGFLQNYYDRYKFKTVVTDSLKNLLEEYTSRDWTHYFDEWIYQQGFPEYLYDYHTHIVGSLYKLDVNLRQAQTPPMCTLFTNPVPVKIVFADSSRNEIIQPTTRDFWTTFWLSDSVLDVIFDQLNIICGTFAWSPSLIGEIVPKSKNLSILAFPNPFNSSVAIDIRSFDVNSRDLPVWITSWKIYNIEGNLVEDFNLRNSNISVGSIDATGLSIWTPSANLPSGIYLLKIEFEGKIYEKKIVYIR